MYYVPENVWVFRGRPKWSSSGKKSWNMVKEGLLRCQTVECNPLNCGILCYNQYFIVKKENQREYLNRIKNTSMSHGKVKSCFVKLMSIMTYDVKPLTVDLWSKLFENHTQVYCYPKSFFTMLIIDLTFKEYAATRWRSHATTTWS